MVFDRYYEYSTRGVTRRSRKTETSRVHQLKVTTELPSQKVILTITEYKKQLIDIICIELILYVLFHRDHIQTHNLFITSEDKTPIEISNGEVIINRRDMNTTHEEADIVAVRTVHASIF